jgi:hypothetical protein
MQVARRISVITVATAATAIIVITATNAAITREVVQHLIGV